MKEELERYKKALEVAEWWIDSCCELGQRKNAHREIDTALNPPPVYETVEEIVGWVNVYPDGSGGFSVCVHDTEEQADEDAGFARLSCQPIKVTVQREKKVPVVMSAHAKGVKFDCAREGVCLWPHGAKLEGDTYGWGGLVGKTVDLTVAWTEEPTT